MVGVEPYIETIGIHFGYGSKYDNEYWELDLCEKCIEELFGDIAQKYRTPEDGMEGED